MSDLLVLLLVFTSHSQYSVLWLWVWVSVWLTDCEYFHLVVNHAHGPEWLTHSEQNLDCLSYCHSVIEIVCNPLRLENSRDFVPILFFNSQTVLILSQFHNVLACHQNDFRFPTGWIYRPQRLYTLICRFYRRAEFPGDVSGELHASGGGICVYKYPVRISKRGTIGWLREENKWWGTDTKQGAPTTETLLYVSLSLVRYSRIREDKSMGTDRTGFPRDLALRRAGGIWWANQDWLGQLMMGLQLWVMTYYCTCSHCCTKSVGPHCHFAVQISIYPDWGKSASQFDTRMPIFYLIW